MAHVAIAQERARWLPEEIGQTAFADTLARTPLVPIAVTFTAGIVADRGFEIPLRDSLIASLAALVAWLIAMRGRQRGLALVYLWGSAAGFGAAYHHWHLHGIVANDIRHFASLEPAPAVVRGVLHSEPVLVRQAKPQPLQTFPATTLTRIMLRATHLKQAEGWRAVSGFALVNAGETISNVHVGDWVEISGRLHAPDRPDNPGEFDYARYLGDQSIGAVLSVQKTAQGIIRLEERWPTSASGWLGAVRGWGNKFLATAMPRTHGPATALLLGESAAMTGEEWEKYFHTGVIHVLAISGQHLVVLAAFLWFALRAVGASQRRGAILVVGVLAAYSLLSGGRPPVVRAAITVTAWAVTVFLHRPLLGANAFALAWLAVAFANPTDVFNAGCQVSFLSVAVLCWGVARWLRREWDPIDELVDEGRSAMGRLAHRMGRIVWQYYALTLLLWLAIAPLVAAHFHIVSPVALLIGPPMVLLTSVALIAGFLLLLLAPIGGPLTWILAEVTELCLLGADQVVSASVNLPYAFLYVPDIPKWWLTVFYAGLFIGLAGQTIRPMGRLLLLSGAAWAGVLLLTFAVQAPEFRCTFLAVGHGVCTVIETPEGQTLVYDAGAMAGPEVTRRQIAPYLWQRGIRWIDELFISHADLDHFNGLPALLERFAVGQITCTPSFADRSIPGVQRTLEAIQRHAIPLRTVKKGDHLRLGSVAMEVLHPPERGPEGKENARSLVLRVTAVGHSILLTGDLEEPGLKMVLALPPAATDVMMAPHHGSKASNTHELAHWARPKMVVSSQGSWYGKGEAPEPYKKIGATFLGTWPDGAITLRMEGNGLVAESYKTRRRVVIGEGLR